MNRLGQRTVGVWVVKTCHNLPFPCKLQEVGSWYYGRSTLGVGLEPWSECYTIDKHLQCPKGWVGGSGRNSRKSRLVHPGTDTTCSVVYCRWWRKQPDHSRPNVCLPIDVFQNKLEGRRQQNFVSVLWLNIECLHSAQHTPQSRGRRGGPSQLNTCHPVPDYL